MLHSPHANIPTINKAITRVIIGANGTAISLDLSGLAIGIIDDNELFFIVFGRKTCLHGCFSGLLFAGTVGAGGRWGCLGLEAATETFPARFHLQYYYSNRNENVRESGERGIYRVVLVVGWWIITRENAIMMRNLC